MAPRRRVLRGNGASVPLPFIIGTIAPGIVARSRRRRRHLLQAKFKDFMQRALELETEDAMTKASRLSSRPPHRTQHLQSEQLGSLRHDLSSSLYRLHRPTRLRRIRSLGDSDIEHRHFHTGMPTTDQACIERGARGQGWDRVW